MMSDYYRGNEKPDDQDMHKVGWTWFDGTQLRW